MATLSEWFEAEAREALLQIDAALSNGQPEPAVLHRAVRALRGAAQMAREEHVFRAASALEAVTRGLADGSVTWNDTLHAAVRDSIARLHSLAEHDDDADTQRATADEVIERLRPAADGLPVDGRAAHAPADAPTPASDAAFMRFAAQEVAGIADALDRGISQLVAAPLDRDALKAILRRQRTLLGAARLDDIPIVAEILRAVEDLTRVVAKLDVGVKQDWLDIYRLARDGLRAALEPLQRGENPPNSKAASRLRHMRQELLEQFGTGDDAADDAPDDAPDIVAAATGAVQRAGGVVPVEALCYTAEDALRQALALHDVIMRATADDAEARAAAEELFDLIRYALG